MPTDVIDPLTEQDSPQQPSLGFLGGVRWMWRQLTSMRTALILLFMLAVAAIPGSIVPQRGVSPIRVQQYFQAHPTLAPFFDTLSFFDVYASPWFAAIYLLLLISLAGCILPRCLHYARQLGAKPPKTPRNLSRLPVYRSRSTDNDQVLHAAASALQSNGFRIQRFEDDASIAGEKGYLHEVGNLVFHLALFVILVGVGWGALFGYHGSVIVVEGDGFSNILTQYDNFTPGRQFDESRLQPFSFRLNRFEADFLTSGPRTGQASDYRAQVAYREEPGADPRTAQISVNHPLILSSAKIFLLGSGYAPSFTVRDGDGNIAFQGAVAALAQDANFTSTTAIKVPDAEPEQLGFNVTVTPTAPLAVDPKTGPKSLFPEMNNPRVFLGAWAGDLGLDTGVPQNIYELDTSDMDQIGIKELAPGQTWKLPAGRGTITFDGLKEYGNFQIAHDPGSLVVLAGATAAILGIMASLLIRRRRVWVRATRDDAGRTLVEFGGLARTEAANLPTELDRIVEATVGPASDGSVPAREGT